LSHYSSLTVGQDQRYKIADCGPNF